jgi:hypothetical protein
MTSRPRITLKVVRGLVVGQVAAASTPNAASDGGFIRDVVAAA